METQEYFCKLAEQKARFDYQNNGKCKNGYIENSKEWDSYHKEAMNICPEYKAKWEHQEAMLNG